MWGRSNLPQVQQSSLNQSLDPLNQKFPGYTPELPPGVAYFFQALLRGEMHQREQGFLRTDLWLPGAMQHFLTIRKW